MIVDASALVAIVLQEPGWPRLVEALAHGDAPAIGAPTLAETAIVLRAKGVPATVLPALVQRAGVRVLPFTEEHATLAADAFAEFGRGRHPAALNFGDCLVYAVARLADAPVLCVGDDFGRAGLATLP